MKNTGFRRKNPPRSQRDGTATERGIHGHDPKRLWLRFETIETLAKTGGGRINEIEGTCDRRIRADVLPLRKIGRGLDDVSAALQPSVLKADPAIGQTAETANAPA